MHMEPAQPTGRQMAAIYFRAEDLARRTVEYHRVREAEHRSRDRYGRRFRAFPWGEAVAAVLSDEALEDEESVVALIKELGRQGCSEVALAALDLVVTRGSPAPTKAMFDAVLLVCATEHQDQRCLEQYGRMRCLGLHPDLGTANLVLTGLCGRGRLEAAMEMLGEMRGQMGIRPNSYSVLMVLQACNHKRRGAYREAIDAVQALEAGGRTANEEVIEALLKVCEAALQQSPSFEAALEVFSALSELHLADCTRVYNGLLAAAGRAGKWREAQALYTRMQEDDVPPSLETHTALIQACVVGRALDHALQIFEHLVSGRSAHEAVPASIATYNHLIHACHQAGMLEKALEIASWVQKTGVEFDDETYGELMATIDVAQLWDDKAMKQARQECKVVLPRNLRPAPYDAMRVMYLDHLDMLQQEELLALEKLGSLGSWASRSLTRGSATLTATPLMSALPSAATSLLTPTTTMMPGVTGIATLSSTTSAATATAVAAMKSAVRGPGSPSRPPGTAGNSATTRSMMPAPPPQPPRAAGYDNRQGYGSAAWRSTGGGGGGGRALSPSTNLQQQQQQQQQQQGGTSNFAAYGQGPWFSPGPGTGPVGMVAAAAVAAERSALPSRSVSPPPVAAAAASSVGGASQSFNRPQSVQQLLKTLSSRPLQGLGPGGPGPGPGSLGGPSVRSAAAAAAAAATAPPPVPAPTGYYDPPAWAQIQTLDAATAGPGGTPYSAAVAAAVQSSGGGADGTDAPLALTLAVEPANLYGQSSAGSLSCSHSRSSLRSMTLGHGNGSSGGGAAIATAGGSFRVMVPAVNGTALPPLSGEALSPVTSALALGMAINPQSHAASGGSGAAAATVVAAAAPGMTAAPPPPGRQRSRAAWSYAPHPGGGGAADVGVAAATAAGSEFAIPNPLPALSAVPVSVSAGGASRRFPVAVFGGGK